MSINIPIINHSYIYPTDTEENKDNILNQAKDDNKEACWVGYGVGDLNSQYQPSPIKEPDYYMQYCNSDNYDYLKDYRLIWGYGIGINETDVIINTDTGEHLAEGTEACDAYIPEEGINTKRGIWLRFTGSTLINPSVIKEVTLPDYIISIKDFTASLTSSQLIIEQFNSENIINWDNAFKEKHINFINSDNSEVTFDLTSAKSMIEIFSGSQIQKEIETVNKVNFINHINKINLNKAFYNAVINCLLDNLFLNYSGGEHLFNNAVINYFPDTFYITVSNGTFYNTSGKVSITTFDNGYYKLAKQITTGNAPFYNVSVKIKSENIDYSDCEYIRILFVNCDFIDVLDLSNLPNIKIESLISCSNKIINIKWPNITLNKYGRLITGDSNIINFENICYCAKLGDTKAFAISQPCIINGFDLKLNVSFCGVGAITFDSTTRSKNTVSENSIINISYYEDDDISDILGLFDDSTLSDNDYFSSCITLQQTVYLELNNLCNSIHTDYFPTTIINLDRGGEHKLITIDVNIKDKIFYHNYNGYGGYKLYINNNSIIKYRYNKDNYPINKSISYNYYVEYINDDELPVTSIIDNYNAYVSAKNIDLNIYLDTTILFANNIYKYNSLESNENSYVRIINTYNKLIYKQKTFNINNAIYLNHDLNISIKYDSNNDNCIFLNIIPIEYSIRDNYTLDTNTVEYNFDYRNINIEHDFDNEIYCLSKYFDYIPYSIINKMYTIDAENTFSKALYTPAEHHINDTEERDITDIKRSSLCIGDLSSFTATYNKNNLSEQRINSNIDLSNDNRPLLIPSVINIFDSYGSSYINARLYPKCKNTKLTFNCTTANGLLISAEDAINLETLILNDYDETHYSYRNNISLYLASTNTYTSVLKNVVCNRKCNEVRADYAINLTAESINSLFNAVTESITINEIIYNTLTEEQIKSLVDKGVTLISINNE